MSTHVTAGDRLPAAFYDRPVVEVARDLIGCVLRHGRTAGAIVEAEAYHHDEPACHAFIGLTPRTEALFGAPGTAYVYRSYGIHALVNAVCESPEVGAAVLIRALEPLDGLEIMRERRGRGHVRDLCSGPGKLSQALGIELVCNGTSLVDGPLEILAPPSSTEPAALLAGPRVGITKATTLPWRFCAAGSPFVSRPWPPGLLDGR